jgi:predicted cupin superfamily sugar epimerase
MFETDPTTNTEQAAALVARLGLQPHPEGGFFRETWRHPGEGTARGAGTAILFLLRAGEVSRWHRVDAAEIWHFYAGSPATLRIVGPDGAREDVRLGSDVLSGERPQAIVPADGWQQTEAGAGWALFGCTVSPAFAFEGFEMAPVGWEP